MSRLSAFLFSGALLATTGLLIRRTWVRLSRQIQRKPPVTSEIPTVSPVRTLHGWPIRPDRARREVFDLSASSAGATHLSLLASLDGDTVDAFVNTMYGETSPLPQHDLMAGCLLEAKRRGLSLHSAFQFEQDGEIALRTLLLRHQNRQAEPETPALGLGLTPTMGPWEQPQHTHNPWTLYAGGQTQDAVAGLLQALSWSLEQGSRAERILQYQRWN